MIDAVETHIVNVPKPGAISTHESPLGCMIENGGQTSSLPNGNLQFINTTGTSKRWGTEEISHCENSLMSQGRSIAPHSKTITDGQGFPSLTPEYDRAVSKCSVQLKNPFSTKQRPPNSSGIQKESGSCMRPPKPLYNLVPGLSVSTRDNFTTADTMANNVEANRLPAWLNFSYTSIGY